MKVHKLEILIVDFYNVGENEIRVVIENANFPNDCISPRVMDFKSVDIGEWDDNNPLNQKDTQIIEFNRLFK